MTVQRKPGALFSLKCLLYCGGEHGVIASWRMCVWRQFSERQVEDASLGNGRKWDTTFIRPFVWVNLKEFETKKRDT